MQQNLIADKVAEELIDRFEAIQIDEKEGQLSSGRKGSNPSGKFFFKPGTAFGSRQKISVFLPISLSADDKTEKVSRPVINRTCFGSTGGEQI